MGDRDRIDLFDRLCEIIDNQRVSEWNGTIHPEDVAHLANALIAAGATMPAPKTSCRTCLRTLRPAGHEGDCW